MNTKEELAPPPDARSWTGPTVYFEALARRRTERRRREPLVRTQPKSPRLLLSTLPFIALIAALGLLAVAIMITAWPGTAASAIRRPAAGAGRRSQRLVPGGRARVPLTLPAALPPLGCAREKGRI